MRCSTLRTPVGEISLNVRREGIVEALPSPAGRSPGLEYQQLMEMAGVDYPERPERFEVGLPSAIADEEPPDPG